MADLDPNQNQNPTDNTPPAQQSTPPANVASTPPANVPPPPATTPAPPATGNNDELKALRDRVAAMEAKDAENTRQALASKIADQVGIKAEAVEFLTGSDEATLRAQAERMKAVFGVEAPPPPPPAGSPSSPPAGSAPTIDEQIASAENEGNGAKAMELMLRKMRGEQ